MSRALEKSLAIRRAGEGDQAACAAIFIETMTTTFPEEPAAARTSAAYAASVLGEEQWLALSGSRIIGYISVYWPSNFIHSLYISPAFQGLGAGRLLMSTVLEQAMGDMELKTDKSNSRAFVFYRRQGWRVVGEGLAATGPWWRLRHAGGVL
ncbi:MAG: GNAT family N-acetyltransferase [Rhodospirillaceae bacterium]|nr:GNAT family N-acetyltransferase [Rhodospirillaceae bacterium]